MCADGVTADLNATTVLEARTKRGLLTRMRDFFADPTLLKAYLSEHCATEVLDTETELFVSQLYLPAYHNVPEAGSVRMCINTTYMKDNFWCAAAYVSEREAMCIRRSRRNTRSSLRHIDPNWSKRIRCSVCPVMSCPSGQALLAGAANVISSTQGVAVCKRGRGSPAERHLGRMAIRHAFQSLRNFHQPQQLAPTNCLRATLCRSSHFEMR